MALRTIDMAETPTYFDASFYMITDEPHIIRKMTDEGIFCPSRVRRITDKEEEEMDIACESCLQQL